MAYIRKLKSGVWQATVRDPSGKRHSTTDPLKSVVKQWATDLEAKFKRGGRHDPRSGELKIIDWHARYRAARAIESITRDKEDSLWRTHCADHWGNWPMEAVTRMEAQAWVNQLSTKRLARYKGKPANPTDESVPTLSPKTVADIVHVMTALYEAATHENPPIVAVNPFRGLKLPKIEQPPPRFYEHEEAVALYAAATRLFGDGWAALMRLGMDVGLRPGELYGLHGDRVDWIRGQIHVRRVVTRRGLREYPKSAKSRRATPVPPDVLPVMARLMKGRPRESPVWTAPEGGLINDSDFRLRIWYPSVGAARLCGQVASEEGGRFSEGRCGSSCDDPAHRIPRHSPSVMRHTAASWLVQAGVSLYKVQELLGHESFATTEKYAHLQPDAHDEVTAAWSARRASSVRQAPG